MPPHHLAHPKHGQPLLTGQPQDKGPKWSTIDLLWQTARSYRILIPNHTGLSPAWLTIRYSYRLHLLSPGADTMLDLSHALESFVTSHPITAMAGPAPEYRARKSSDCQRRGCIGQARGRPAAGHCPSRCAALRTSNSRGSGTGVLRDTSGRCHALMPCCRTTA